MKAAQFVAELTKMDAKTLAKFQDSKTPEQAYAVAKQHGLDDTLGNFTAEMKKLNESVTALNEEELDAVAGGISSDIKETIELSAATAGAATAAVGAAASAAAA